MPIVAAVLSIVLLAAAADAEVLQPGAAFPAWEMTDHTGAEVTSRELAGKTYLLWFYPKAMTPGCTAEGNGLRDRFAAFQARGVEILGVSFDDPETNAEFVKAQGFPFRLLSDTDHRLAVSVGAAMLAIQPFARRVSYLVGPDGKVVKAYTQVAPATHAQEVLADLGGTAAAAPPAAAPPVAAPSHASP
jgi:peroxiredoxin Q/BCP